MIKEIKIRFHHDDKGYCREFWEIFSEDKQKPPRFLIRDIGGFGGSWCSASGEFHEPGFNIAEDLTLILCNHTWDEYMRVSNDRNRFPIGLPTLEDACRTAWYNFTGKPTHCLDTPAFWKWIDPYIPSELPIWEQHNWQNNYRKTLDREELERFDFCGDQMAIVRITERHTKCSLTWRKYFADWAGEDRYPSYALFFGYEVGNYVINSNPLQIANLPWQEMGMNISAEDLETFNAMIGISGKAPFTSSNRKVRRLVELLKENAAQRNKGLKPHVNKDYACRTCGSNSGECHPLSSYCFNCGTDNWQPVKQLL